jgi:hypothetical protein
MKSERSRFEKAGIEPGEAYRGLWLHLLDVKDRISHAKNDEDKKYWLREYSLTLHRILPYERPRLTAVKVSGDPDAPVMSPEMVAETLAKTLSIAELELLDKVALKLVAGPVVDIDATSSPGPAAQRVKPR